jgi:hypothetical protein
VLVTAGEGISGAVVARPNLLKPKQGVPIATFDGTGIANAFTLTVNIYTITGELVKAITGPSGTAMASWNATRIASGIYIASVEVQDGNGGVIKQQLMRILVLH